MQNDEYQNKCKRLKALKEALIRKQSCGGCGRERDILRVKITCLEAEIKRIDEAVGVHSRPVGNYNQQINLN
jgi:hypothetical protein